MNYRIEDNGIAIEKDRFSTGINGDFYLYEEIRDYADTLVENFTKQTNFAYFGDLESPPWGQLGFAGQHRDSDALDRSNHEVIRDALMEIRPDSFTVEGSSHWLVGWVDVIRVDTSDDVAVAAVMCWRDALENYPVADDEHFSNTEMNDADESWDSWGRLEFERWCVEHDDEYGASSDLPLIDSEGVLTEAGEHIGHYAFTDAHREDSSDYEYYLSDAVTDWQMLQRIRFEEVQPPLTD
jgi:hypothetical protein